MIFQTAPATYTVSPIGSSSSLSSASPLDSASTSGAYQSVDESVAVSAIGAKSLAGTESLSALLIALCTSDLSEFLSIKRKLADFPMGEVCVEAQRLMAKNSRSFKLLSVVSHFQFFADWEASDAKHQVTLYGELALYSINKSMKEVAFHRVAKALRKDCLLHQSVSKPTKLRLRDCHALIGQFMHDYAILSDVNRAVVLNALAEGEQTGCGHLPSQQAVALAKKLSRR